MSSNAFGKKYLVTGGTGFIGGALVRGLLDQGAQVRSLDNDSRGHRSRLDDVASRIELFEGDIRDPQAVRRAMAGVDSVFHLAYLNGTEHFYTRPELVLDIAVKGISNVIDAAIAEKVPELVLASSSEVYQTPATVPTDERAPLVVPDPLNPRYSYGGGKIISELMALNFGRKHFERVMIFRPHNVYGPDMGGEHVIPQLALRVKALHEKNPRGPIALPIQGTGQETRAFVFIDDMVAGLMRMTERGEHLGIYHIGTDQEVSIAEVARMVGRCFGREIAIVPGELRPGGTPRRCPDISKIRALGYAPRVSLQEGIEKTIRWYDESWEKRRS